MCVCVRGGGKIVCEGGVYEGGVRLYTEPIENIPWDSESCSGVQRMCACRNARVSA